MSRSALPGGQRGWWFEDAAPGRIFVHGGGRTITNDEHARLAWLTDNASEVHGNADRAARSQFGDLLVLGALSVAIVAGLAAPAVGRDVPRLATFFPIWRTIRLVAPVRGGDTVRAVSEFEGVVPDHDGRGGFVERTVIGRNQREEEIVRIVERVWAPSHAHWNKGLLTSIVPPSIVR